MGVNNVCVTCEGCKTDGECLECYDALCDECNYTSSSTIPLCYGCANKEEIDWEDAVAQAEARGIDVELEYFGGCGDPECCGAPQRYIKNRYGEYDFPMDRKEWNEWLSKEAGDE